MSMALCKLSAGWTTDCLQEWGSYMKLAIPSVFMICFEWWIWEFGGFLAGQCSIFDTLDSVPNFFKNLYKLSNVEILTLKVSDECTSIFSGIVN